MVKVTLLPTANLAVHLPFTSLVCPGWCCVATCCTASTPPVVFTMRRLLLLSSCNATSTSHCLEVPPAFRTPPPLVHRCLRLVITIPLVVPLPILILSTITASCLRTPPLLLASCLPASCRIALVVALLPPPLVLSTCRSTSQQVASVLQRAAASCLLAPLLSFASLLPAGCHITSNCTAASSFHPQPPCLHLHRLVVALHLIALLLPPILLSIPLPLNALATHLPFVSHSPQLVACVFDLVCPISRFMAICQGYAPTYTYKGGGVYI
jgi:hypothetical protein